MLQHSNSANEMLLRRKLEEQQQAVELQQAIELQSRRLMGLQLLDLKTRSAAAAAPPPSASRSAPPTRLPPPRPSSRRPIPVLLVCGQQRTHLIITWSQQMQCCSHLLC